MSENSVNFPHIEIKDRLNRQAADTKASATKANIVYQNLTWRVQIKTISQTDRLRTSTTDR